MTKTEKAAETKDSNATKKETPVKAAATKKVAKKAAAQKPAPKRAPEGFILVVSCAKHGELKRRTYMSDAQGWRRSHEKESPKCSVTIAARKVA